MEKPKTLINLPAVGFKHEITPYRVESLTYAYYNYNLNNDLKVASDIETSPQQINSGRFSKFPSISGKKSIILNFSVDMYYLNNVSIPNYYSLLESCGWKRTHNALDVLIIETNENSINIEINDDDDIHIYRVAVENVIMSQSHKTRVPSTISCIYPQLGTSPKQLEYLASGAMGTVEFSGKIGEPVKISFSFLGCLNSIKTRQYSDLILPLDLDTASPKSLMESTVQVNGENVDIVEFKVICGNVLSLFSNISSQSGYDGTRITDKVSSGVVTINPNIDNISAFMNYISNETTLSIRNGRLLLQFEGVQFNSLTDDYSKWSFDVHKKIIIAQEDI